MLRKIGVFLFLVGLIVTMVSFASGNLNKQSLTLFLIGVPLVLLGGLIWNRNRDTDQVERFRLVRKFKPKSKGDQEEG
jgi:hypothetical protein